MQFSLQQLDLAINLLWQCFIQKSLAFFFNGQNVTDFLDQFLYLCKNYKLLKDKKIKQLLKYCDIRIRQIIEIMKE